MQRPISSEWHSGGKRAGRGGERWGTGMEGADQVLGRARSAVLSYTISYSTFLFPQHRASQTGTNDCAGANLSSPIGQAGALHRVREQISPYPMETPNLLLTSAGYSMGHAEPLHRHRRGLGCTFVKIIQLPCFLQTLRELPFEYTYLGGSWCKTIFDHSFVIREHLNNFRCYSISKDIYCTQNSKA